MSTLDLDRGHENRFFVATQALGGEMNAQQRLAFLHGASVLGEIFPYAEETDTVVDLVKKAIEAETDNPVTKAFQHSEEFALGAMLTAYEMRTRKVQA